MRIVLLLAFLLAGSGCASKAASQPGEGEDVPPRLREPHKSCTAPAKSCCASCSIRCPANQEARCFQGQPRYRDHNRCDCNIRAKCDCR